METPQEQAEQAIKDALIRALESSSELIQEMQKVPLNSPLYLIRKGSLARTLSGTWGPGHLESLSYFAVRAGILSDEEQIAGFRFRNKVFNLINEVDIDRSKKPIYLDEKKLGALFVTMGGSRQRAMDLYPGYGITSPK